MSNEMREIVRLTRINGFGPKSLLLHIADTVRNHDLRCWQSQQAMADSLGTNCKTIRRNLNKLLERDLIRYLGPKPTKRNPVDVYEIVIESLLALPCIDPKEDRRPDLVEKIRTKLRADDTS